MKEDDDMLDQQTLNELVNRLAMKVGELETQLELVNITNEQLQGTIHVLNQQLQASFIPEVKEEQKEEVIELVEEK